ncbi:MAG: hypothetical protein WCX22_03530 [Methanoregula sp.]
MRFIRIFSSTCLVIAALVILSVSIHPVMAAEAINKQMDGCAACHTSAGGFSSLPGMEDKRMPTVHIREIAPELSPSGTKGLSTAGAPDGIQTYHPREGLTLEIRDPFAGPLSQSARETSKPRMADGSGTAASPGETASSIAAITANMSRAGYDLAGESAHRYESTVTSDDLLAMNTSQKTALAAEGFVLTAEDTAQSYRDVTLYTFTSRTTQNTITVMAVRQLDPDGNPLGDPVIAISPVFSKSGENTRTGTVFASSSGGDSCAWKWFVVALLAIGLVVNIAIIIAGTDGAYAPMILSMIGMVIGTFVNPPLDEADNQDYWMFWAVKSKGAITAMAIVSGVILLLYLLYAIYDLGVCMGWWEPVGLDKIVWSYQERFLDADNGKTVTLDLQDRIALALFTDTRADETAHWIIESGAGFKVRDSNAVKTENGTLQSWYLESRKEGAQDLILRYVSTKPVPPTIAHTTYTIHTNIHPGNWAITTVDETTASEGTGKAVSLAINTAGIPHIGYYDEANKRVMYATRVDTRWQREQVAGSSGTTSTSISLDRSGAPSISFGDGQYFSTLFYAARSESGWNVTTVDKGSAGDAGGYSSLARDRDGVPHIAYNDGHTFATLMYATMNSSTGSWDPVAIDNGGAVGDTGYGSSLEFDAAGHPHIAYTAGKHFADLMYAFNDGVSWAITRVDDGGGRTTSSGLNPSLALDSHGFPHISYYSDSDAELRYASWNGTTWEKETIDSDNDEGKYSALVIDAQDRPYIGYYDASYGELMYATRATPESVWKIHIVDTEGDAGQYVKVALDPAGHPCFVYYDATNHALRYAEWKE